MMNGRERPRMPPSGDTPPLRDPRRAGDGRNGGFGSPAESTMSRAEKFEDEKRRIIGSCFNKKDSDGSCALGFPLSPSPCLMPALTTLPPTLVWRGVMISWKHHPGCHQ